MRVPFAIWSGFLALLVYGGFVGLEFMNFGELNLMPGLALRVGGVWLVLVILVAVIGMVRNAATSRPAHVPDDVAREISRHPKD